MTVIDRTDARDVRLRIRAGEITTPTAGLAPGFVQANIAILPARYAADFERFCRLNPQSCPLLAMGEPGDPSLPALGADIDMRHDLPLYRIYRNGAVAAEVTDIADLWTDDLVTFALGCSFTFEHALMAEGIPLRHVEQGRNVAMYRTRHDTVASGPFAGKLVVSMRPIHRDEVARAGAISARFPDMHGAPVHSGDPAELGIADLARPDYGDAVSIEADEHPVFWACGVTSQAVLEAAGIPFFIAHAPGMMLITDRRHPAA